MSDVDTNYENTKRTVRVPPGWMIVNDIPSMDPVNKNYMWWHPTEGPNGTWIKLDVTSTDPEVKKVHEDLQALWPAGASIFIEPDPTPAPPPPPAFLAPGFMPPPPPSAVAPSEVVAAPAPAAPPPPPPPPARAEVAPPVAVPAISAPATFVPPPPPAFNLPVAPAVAPVVVQPVVAAVPQAPAPIAIPVRVKPPVAVAPVAAPTPATLPVATPSGEAPESEADPNAVDAWLAALDGVKDRIKALEAVKAELVAKIVKQCFPDGLKEGAQNCKLPDGRKLTITGVVNRTFDDALVNDACQKIVAAGGNPEGVFVSKLALGTAAYKALPVNYRNLLADCVTEKDGTPQLKITEPKK